MLLLLVTGLALADEPLVEHDGTTVRASARLAVPAQRVLAELADPTWEGRVSSSDTQVELLGEEGGCQLVRYTSPNVVQTAVYEVRRCPTADGWHSTLRSSEAFHRYSARWQVVAEGDGAQLRYELDLEPAIKVPAVLVRAETRRSLLRMMRAIVSWSEQQGG